MARKQKMHSPLKIFAIITNCKYCVEYQNNKVIVCISCKLNKVCFYRCWCTYSMCLYIW